MKPTRFLTAALAAATLATASPAVAAPSLTIYNQNFAVVRDTVPLALQPGVNDIRYSGMTALLEPDSVLLRDPAGQAAFQILEQSYRNDPVTAELLLDLCAGQTIDFFVKEPNKPDQTIRGKIIRSGYRADTQPVIEIDGKLRFSLPGLPVFPSLGDDTILNPTLFWKIESATAATLAAELAYVTGGFTWHASYNLVAPERGDLIDVVGWVTIDNTSGRTFADAQLKLMAGDVHKLQPGPAPMARAKAALFAAEMEAPVTEKAFDEFHLYSLAHPTTLRDRETKQVEFLRAAGVKSSRFYVYDGAILHGWRPGIARGDAPQYGTECNKKVNVFREFLNSRDNRLGIPLPKGRVRFYRQDDDRRLEFIGENELDHTPQGELVRLYTGDAFDLVGERRQTDFRVDTANRQADESFAIDVRNRKKEPAEIRVVEHLYRWLTWDIREPSQAFAKKDAQTIEFVVPLRPDETKTVTYQVHYTW